jgi:hypothetical protein
MQTQVVLEELPTMPVVNPPSSTWRFRTLIAFRFAFSYFVLYNIPFPIGALPYTDAANDKYQELWHHVVPWVAKHFLHLGYDITVFSNGSGDTTYDYVLVLCFAALAFITTLAWSWLDRAQTSYPRLYAWFRLYMRLALANAMIAYGAFKVIPSQFPAMSLSNLMQTYGDSSPMGLLWKFMGASTAYTIFAGCCELLGGLLLLIPRLTTLGSLVSTAVLSNVLMLNMSYDVPVKLYSFHLLLMAMVLVIPDAKRLADFFVLNREARPARAVNLFDRPQFNRAALVLQLGLGVIFAATYFYQSEQAIRSDTSHPPFYGVWSVDEFSLDGQVVTPEPSHTTRWNRILFEFTEVMTIQPLTGSPQNFRLEINQDKKTLTLTRRIEPDFKAEFTFDNSQPEIMSLEGQFSGHPTTAKLHRTNVPSFLLRTRGFHWINEYPFNR